MTERANAILQKMIASESPIAQTISATEASFVLKELCDVASLSDVLGTLGPFLFRGAQSYDDFVSAFEICEHGLCSEDMFDVAIAALESDVDDSRKQYLFHWLLGKLRTPPPTPEIPTGLAEALDRMIVGDGSTAIRRLAAGYALTLLPDVPRSAEVTQMIEKLFQLFPNAADCWKTHDS